MSSPLPDDTEVLEGAQAQARILSMGIEPDWLIRAVVRSEMIRRSTSPFEPSIAPGFKAWSACVGELAEVSAAGGFEKQETQGLPRIVNPRTGVAIAVVTGDEETGRKFGSPKSKSPRGPISRIFVQSNQFPFPWHPDSEPPEVEDEDDHTWWLVMFADDSSIRAELSLPIGFSADSKLSMWKTRLLLDIPTDGIIRSNSSSNDDDLPIEIDIPVRRR